MPAPKGNQFWKLADPECLGKPRLFKTPKDLWEACKPYFEHVDNNPFVTTETTQSEKGTYLKEVNHKIPYTWEGLYTFLGISNLDRYREKEEYAAIITHIGSIIRNHKFSGASAGIFNANIIARDLGLMEKTDITSNGKDVSGSPTVLFVKQGEKEDESSDKDK